MVKLLRKDKWVSNLLHIKIMSNQPTKNIPDDAESKTRDNLVKLLSGFLEEANAHITFQDAVKNIPARYYGIKPEGLPYSLWQEIEHIRITQKDILAFCQDANYQSPSWPEGYWPSNPAPSKESEWKESIKMVISDRKEFISLLDDSSADLYKPFSYGNGQNLIREALLIIDHTAYHVGQIIIIRRLLGIYK